MKESLLITKASGLKEPLDLSKLSGTLERLGLASQVAHEISQAVAESLPSQTTSDEILQRTLAELRRRDKKLAARYNLKRAIMDLGPTGFPFEHYVARILNAYGYETTVGQRVPGYCVVHEVDVVAKKGNRHIIIECKYHNDRGSASDLHVAMYTHARFLDIQARWEDQENSRRGQEAHFHEVWLVTNTRCTSDAIAYAQCHDVKILAWNFPPSSGADSGEASPSRSSLERVIEYKNLYPITVLPAVRPALRDALFAKNLYLASDLSALSPKALSQSAGLPINVAQRVVGEALALIAPNHKSQITNSK